MGTFTKGDVVLFPFPFTDLTSRKVRPCLVLSDEMKEDIILCQITSKMVKKDLFCVEIKSSSTINGTIQIDSLIRCNMIFTASKKQILKKVCELSQESYGEVLSTIDKIMRR